MRKLVTIETIQEKKSIPGADRIEAVRVRDWWVVAKKDEFHIGDFCIYYEIDSFLPVKLEYDFLLNGSHPKKMLLDGKEVEGIRLKTVKLRGQLSQGLVLPHATFPGLPTVSGEDVSEILGVSKYEQPVPASLAGVAKGFFPSFIPKTDEERIQNMAEVLSGYYVTEKLDGTSTTYYKKGGVLGVCSRNLELAEGDSTQWQIARRYDLANKLPDNFAIQCELIGEGIQKNPLKQSGTDIYCFSAYNIDAGIYLNYMDFIGLCKAIGIKTVPILDDNFSLPSSIDGLLAYAEGKSALNKDYEREGVVVRPKIEMSYKGNRFSFKAISNRSLLSEE